MKNVTNHEHISLYKWIWKSYIHTALIPLLIIELIFILAYFSLSIEFQQKTTLFFKGQVQNQLEQIVTNEANLINQQLSSITNSTLLFSNQMEYALSTPASLTSIDSDRLTYLKDGSYYTKEDSKSGGAAIFYSGTTPTKEEKQNKVAMVLTQQTLMADIKNTQPLATSIHLNTFDSLNVSYPYFDVTSRYTNLVNTNFHNPYYDTAEHNPSKNIKWTDVYLDPAGNGLITSTICPVYTNNFLEGFVGIDMTIGTITNKFLTINIPWQGCALLMTNDGSIIALPNSDKTNWALNELNENDYRQSLLNNNFSSDQFNLYKNNYLSLLKNEVTNNTTGFSNFTFKGKPRVISWSTIPNTGWKLLIIVPEQNIYANINVLRDNLIQISIFIILGLILSYLVFSLIFSKKARKMTYVASNSLLEINDIVHRISHGEYTPETPALNIKELNDLSVHLIKMGQHLGEINKSLLITESELRKKEIDLESLVNSISDVILEVDSKGCITNFWSRTQSNLYEFYTEGNFNYIADILDKDTATIAQDKISYVLQTGKTTNIDYILELNSELRWFQACISLRLNSINKVVVSSRDITDQKEMSKSLIVAKEEAEKANKAKSEFLSSMSHELRTPLNAILGFSQILELDPESPLTDSQHESVNEILKAGNHLLELINEVLDLSKIESGKLSISIEAVPIKSVMEETFAIIKPFADKNNIKIITYPTENLNEFVLADHTRLKQILLNLLSNAIKYNKQNGEVTFYHDRINDKFRFHVIDTGIGLSPCDLDVIFKPFHRLNKLNNKIEGTGIGLAVAKQLVELMDGKIYVNSEKNIGSHFFVEFPCVAYHTLQDSEISILAENQNYFPENNFYKVLYIEDNPANLRLIERILMQINNIEMLSATSGELGIDLAIAHKPDIILLDINLPGIDGYEVFKRLKLSDETNNIPIVAISAHAMPKDIEKCISLGFADYITKPIDVQRFTESISNILANNESKNLN